MKVTSAPYRPKVKSLTRWVEFLHDAENNKSQWKVVHCNLYQFVRGQTHQTIIRFCAKGRVFFVYENIHSSCWLERLWYKEINCLIHSSQLNHHQHMDNISYKLVDYVHWWRHTYSYYDNSSKRLFLWSCFTFNSLLWKNNIFEVKVLADFKLLFLKLIEPPPTDRPFVKC